jgi:hypothetical protein
MVRITRCTRSMTSAKSNSMVADLNPRSFALRACAMNFAERNKAFEGTQPVFRQSPPMRCFSTSVTLALTAAAM